MSGKLLLQCLVYLHCLGDDKQSRCRHVEPVYHKVAVVLAVLAYPLLYGCAAYYAWDGKCSRRFVDYKQVLVFKDNFQRSYFIAFFKVVISSFFWGNNGNSNRLYFLGLQNHCRW